MTMLDRNPNSEPHIKSVLRFEYPWVADGPWVGKRCPVERTQHSGVPCKSTARYVATPLGKDPLTDGRICCGKHLVPVMEAVMEYSNSSAVVQEIARLRSARVGKDRV